MDEIVFNDIYDKYVNPVWRTALYYSGNQTDAEEITQLTFIQLLISYETIQNKDAIEAWLLTTARRLLEKETPGSDELIFMQEHRRKDIEFTNTMLEELYRHNSKWYDAVVRAYALEIPQKQIAEEMGIRLEAFQSMLFRAKKWIKTKYEADYREMK